MGFAKRGLYFLLVIAFLLLLGYFWPYFTGKVVASNGTNISVKESGIVTRVVDGDTIHVNLNGKEENIRLLGINNLKV